MYVPSLVTAAPIPPVVVSVPPTPAARCYCPCYSCAFASGTCHPCPCHVYTPCRGARTRDTRGNNCRHSSCAPAAYYCHGCVCATGTCRPCYCSVYPVCRGAHACGARTRGTGCGHNLCAPDTCCTCTRGICCRSCTRANGTCRCHEPRLQYSTAV